MFKKDMVPLTPKGTTSVHPDKTVVRDLAQAPTTMNDYAKATPAPKAVTPLPAGPFPRM